LFVYLANDNALKRGSHSCVASPPKITNQRPLILIKEKSPPLLHAVDLKKIQNTDYEI